MQVVARVRSISLHNADKFSITVDNTFNMPNPITIGHSGTLLHLL